MVNARRRRCANDAGAAVVEFAIVVPLLLLILFGLIDFGRLFFVQLSAKNAVREVARQLAVNNGPAAAAAQTAFNNSIISFSNLSSAPITWTISPTSCGDPSDPDAVSVSVSVPFKPVIPLALTGMDVPASTTMRCE